MPRLCSHRIQAVGGLMIKNVNEGSGARLGHV